MIEPLSPTLRHTLTALAAEHGTPLYVYQGEVIEHQYHELLEAFKDMPVRIKYAAKALTNLSILKLIQKLGCGMDAVSMAEVQLGLKAGFSPADILFTPNGVPFSEIEEAVKAGALINIDNLVYLDKFGKAFGNKVPVCIRLNPHIVAGGHAKIQTGHIDSKFGISILQLKAILQIVEKHQLRINGLHIHSGSDFLDPDVFIQGAQILFEAASHFPDLDFLDFGSGFKVAYQNGDVVTPIYTLGRRLSEAVNAFNATRAKPVEIWFEPGKFLVSEAGLLITTSNLVKITPSSTFVFVDSGLNHLIRPMMYDAYHHIENISNPTGEEKIYNVVGYICETDTFGYERPLPEVREGDLLVFRNAGAYGYSMSSNYNSRPRPAEILLYRGKSQLIRRRETLEDLVSNQVVAEI
jgi:diaminopimelate decarboxylase